MRRPAAAAARPASPALQLLTPLIFVSHPSPSRSKAAAVIYASERNLGNATGTRLFSVSADAGATFSRSGTAAGLPDVVTSNWTGVVSGLSRFDARGAGAGLLVFTTPAAAGVRANLSLWLSRDAGATWGAPALQLWGGPAAYSDVSQLNETHVGVVFEGGSAASGDFAAAIYFAAVAVPM